MTQTTARFVVRPVANAFGMSVSAMATMGLGMSAIAQSRSTMACSWGACSGATTRACIENSASRSENHHCPTADTPAISRTKVADNPTQISTAMSTT